MKDLIEVSSNKLDESTVELSVTVKASEFENRFRQMMKVAAQSTKIPGFRPGKIPFQILKQKFGPTVEEEVANELTKDAYAPALEIANVEAIAPGTIDNITYGLGQNFHFIAKVPVLPDFEITGLDTLSTWMYKPTILDIDLEDALEEFRTSRAKYTIAELPAREDSYLECTVARYDEHKNPVSKEPASFDHLPVKDDPFGVGSTQQLVGITAGETKFIEIVESHEHEGETHHHKHFYQVVVSQVKEQMLAELNDDFARSVSAAYDSLDELKAAIKENLETQSKQRAEEGVLKRIIEFLLQANEFEVSKPMIEDKIRLMLSEFGENANKLSKDFIEKYIEPKAKSDAKWDMLLRKIVQTWEISIPDEQVDEEIISFAKKQKESFESLKEQFLKDGRYHNVRVELAKSQAGKQIRERATIEEKSIPFSEFKKLQEI